ncbi:hypothetical protein TA3x_000530 [Tundrisphaera sp. TA3]|uniref:hypothetical protein n=1 Tax=Tundrisphaera sp. TA3 TaxID=3435775 RepID=UPI003EBE4E53
MSEQRNLPESKKSDKQVVRAADEARARKLLGQAVSEVQKAEDAEGKEAALKSQIAAVKKKKAEHYWEAGRLLTEARRTAPFGTWTRLLEEAGLPTVHDHNWRMLFEEFQDPTEIQDIKITDALALAKERRAAKKATEGLSASKADAKKKGLQGGRPESQDGEIFGFRIWSEPGGGGLPIVHAVRKGQRGWTPQCRVHWDLGHGSGAPPLGDEADVNCPGCIGKLAAARAEAGLHEAAKRPHGSDLGYVWEILDGDDPDVIDARWLPIKEVKGKRIITPEKTIEPIRGEPIFRDRREALESARLKYQQTIEADKAEIERLKAEEERLRQEKRLAERKLKKIESLLAQEV